VCADDAFCRAEKEGGGGDLGGGSLEHGAVALEEAFDVDGPGLEVGGGIRVEGWLDLRLEDLMYCIALRVLVRATYILH
jgi:hypothetical protein